MKYILIGILLSHTVAFAKIKKPVGPASILSKAESRVIKLQLLKEFKRKLSKKEILVVKKETMALGGKAIPALVEVMKSNKYPDKNRWVATFLVAKITGKKGATYLSKYLKHPNWVMRMAALKSLLGLKAESFGHDYARALSDKSFLVRVQALENIRELNLEKYAPMVWAMLYDKENYYANKKKGRKRTNIIKQAIKTVGDLKFKKALKPLFSMVQKKRYKDIFSEMDYSLEKITGRKSPKGLERVKKRFWKKVSVSYNTIN